jgi:branched-chain amino acid transport system permease protein
VNNILLKHKNHLPPAGILIVAFLLPVFLRGFNYEIGVLCFILLYIVAVSGLDILYGYCGQISLGQAGFFAIGAYGSAMLPHYFGIPHLPSMFLASMLGAVVGAIIAYPASKLVFHFLALATMAFGEIVRQFVAQSPNGITGNSLGFFAERLTVFGIRLGTPTSFYYFSLVCVIFFLIVKERLTKSRMGRAFMAIRESPEAAAAMGVDVVRYKIIAFTTSAFFTAFAGAMYMYLVRYVSPEAVVQRQSVMFLTMLLFGGTGSLWGPICGSVAILVLNELIRFAERYQMLVYGALLLLVILLLPGGVYGETVNLINRIKNRKKDLKSHVDGK